MSATADTILESVRPAAPAAGVEDTTTIVDVLRRRAAESPATRAFTFLVDGEDEEATLTWGELDADARAIAARLRERVDRGSRAILMYEPGLAFVGAFFGCLYAGVVPVAVHPPDPRRLDVTLAKVAAIAADAGAEVALTSRMIEPLLGGLGELAPGLARLEWVVTDGIEGEADGPDHTPVPADLAFIQYTSGSTGDPQGVMVDHRRLMAQSALIQEGMRTGPDTTTVSWTPVSHDMGLLGNVVQPAYAGCHTVLLSPVAYLQRPFRWLRAISRYRGEVCGGPNFAYELCTRKIKDHELASIDLSCWRLAYISAEPVRAETIDRFVEKFAPAGFRRGFVWPAWGLAEATCAITGNDGPPEPVVRHLDCRELEQGRVREVAADAPQARRYVGSGRPLYGHAIAIVDPDSGERCAPDGIGEVWLRGSSVTAGYWKRPERTEEVFGATLPGSEERWLRTGDIGFMLDGQLFVVGRAKDVIIVRGRNLAAHDIELTVERSCPGARPGCGVAIAIEADRSEALAVVQEVADPERVDAREAIERIRGAVTYEHGVRPAVVVLLEPRSIPKTSSGKLRRHAVRSALADGTLEAIALEGAG